MKKATFLLSGLSQDEVLWFTIGLMLFLGFGFYFFLFIPRNNKKVESALLVKYWIPHPDKDPGLMYMIFEGQGRSNPRSVKLLLEDNVEPKLHQVHVHRDYYIEIRKKDDLPWEDYLPSIAKALSQHFKVPVEIEKNA